MTALPIDDHAGNTVPLTRHARRALRAKACHLRERVIPELAALLRDPDHDSRIDEDYHRATRQLAELTSLLARSEPVEVLPDDPRRVDLGEAVTVRHEDGSLERYLIVHPAKQPSGASGSPPPPPSGWRCSGGASGSRSRSMRPAARTAARSSAPTVNRMMTTTDRSGRVSSAY